MQKIIIPENLDIRIDKFLLRNFFSNIPRTEIIRKIKRGDILVNKKIVKPNYHLKKANLVEINLKKPPKNIQPNSKIKFEIIFRNNDFLVINKPAGLTVHPLNFSDNTTLVSGLLAQFPEIKNIGDKSVGSKLRPGIVHRLDKETSGVMLVAKNQKTFTAFKKMFQQRKIEKHYLAWVYGQVFPQEGTIEKALSRSKNYKKQIIAKANSLRQSRTAVTYYKVKKIVDYFSLLEVFPKTGRTHQIRIHLASLGHPVVGDKLYKAPQKLRKISAERQLLHAERIIFSLGGKTFAFQVASPQDFSYFSKSLLTGSLDEKRLKS
ncbi:RluA family pseudouridine synthase [Patescibacteria group bacterium]|nr:RluA family pseudouridine synthase [Patescibacteria group bacterium]